jgi:hypothetical protein
MKGTCESPFFVVYLYNNMRYTVRFYNGIQIINDLSTNDLSVAIKREVELRKVYGNDKVWMADILLEMMVG